MRIGKHLELDVTRPFNVLLDQNVIVFERLQRLSARRLDSARKLGSSAYDAHSLAATAMHGFDHDGIACDIERRNEGREPIFSASRASVGSDWSSPWYPGTHGTPA